MSSFESEVIIGADSDVDTSTLVKRTSFELFYFLLPFPPRALTILPESRSQGRRRLSSTTLRDTLIVGEVLVVSILGIVSTLLILELLRLLVLVPSGGEIGVGVCAMCQVSSGGSTSTQRVLSLSADALHSAGLSSPLSLALRGGSILGFPSISLVLVSIRSGTLVGLKSMLTHPALDALCENYHIPDVVHPQLPGSHDKIRNSPTEMDLLAFIRHADPKSQGCWNDNVNKGVNDVAKAGQAKRGNRIVDIRGIEIVANEEIQAIVADQPKKIKKKRKVTDGAGGSGYPSKKLREDHGTSGDAGASVAGKSLVALQGLLKRSTLAAEVGVTAAATVPFVTSFVTPTPEHEGGGGEDYAIGPIIRTQPALERFVVLTDSSYYFGTNAADDELTSIVRSSKPPPPVLNMAVTTTVVPGATSVPVYDLSVRQVNLSIFRDSASLTTTKADVAGPSQPVGTDLSAGSFYISQDMDAKTLRQVYISKWNVINDFVLDDPDVCRGMIDHLAPPGFFSQL
nr:hypothetical protein [Tanacetum cinerariifolium]